MMKLHRLGCLMTAKDFQICERMLAGIAGSASPLVRLLRSKLALATVVAAESIDPLTVTLNSRVEFQADDGPPQMRIIVRSEFQNGLVGLTLPISIPRGLALLGMRQGQQFVLDGCDHAERIFLRRTLYQPEAARFGRGAGGSPAAGRPLAEIIDFETARNAGAVRAGRRTGSNRSSLN